MGPAVARDHEPFFHAVVRHPDDDSLRLRLAEALDGDSRYPSWSDFIRRHVRLADLGSVLDQPGGFALLQEAKSLWQSSGSAWIPYIWNGLELPPPRYEHYHRGMLELLEAPDNRIVEAGDELFRLTPIRHVNVLSLERYSLSEVIGSLAGRGIRSLSLQSLDVTGAQVRDLDWSAVSSIRWLSLAGNDALTREDVAALVRSLHANVPELVFVDFDGMHADPREPLLYDQDAAVGSRLPDWARELEDSGVIPWLHPEVSGGRAALMDRLLLGVARNGHAGAGRPEPVPPM
jgi:uncharacterized protein (TIGR02996 family)